MEHISDQKTQGALHLKIDVEKNLHMQLSGIT